MPGWLTELLVGALALCGTLTGAWLANRKSAALVAYRLEQLEQKVDKHNRLVERTYKLEEEYSVLEERLREAGRRIEDLEGCA